VLALKQESKIIACFLGALYNGHCPLVARNLASLIFFEIVLVGHAQNLRATNFGNKW